MHIGVDTHGLDSQPVSTVRLCPRIILTTPWCIDPEHTGASTRTAKYTPRNYSVTSKAPFTVTSRAGISRVIPGERKPQGKPFSPDWLFLSNKRVKCRGKHLLHILQCCLTCASFLMFKFVQVIWADRRCKTISGRDSNLTVGDFVYG